MKERAEKHGSIRGHTAKKPFFLYMATTLPHKPAPFESMYSDARITPAGFLEKAPDVQPDRMNIITIDVNSIKNKDVREVGAEWLCFQAISQLRLDKREFGSL